MIISSHPPINSMHSIVAYAIRTLNLFAAT